MRYFPLTIPILDILNKTLSIFNIYSTFLLQKMDNAILGFLHQEYGELIEKYLNTPVISFTSESPGTIWTCWWQGIENAPILVQQCIASIHCNADNHPVVVITWDNLNKYADIPEHIISLAKNGDLSLTHLSDVLRANLLANHGGQWVDSTMFCLAPLNDALWNELIFSPVNVIRKKGVNFDSRGNISWCIWLLMGQKSHPLYCCMDEFYNHFFSKYPIELHYFMTDYFIEVANNLLGFFSNQTTNHKSNNPYAIMIDSVNKHFAYNEFPPTHYYKTTYKKDFPEFAKDGRLTVIGCLTSNSQRLLRGPK